MTIGFWINLPIGGLTIGALLLFLDSRTLVDEKRSVVDRFRAIDVLGFVLFSGAVLQLTSPRELNSVVIVGTAVEIMVKS